MSYLLTGSGDLSFLTSAEASHMADVQKLVFRGLLVALGCVVMLLVYHRVRPLSSVVIRDALIMSGALLITLIPFSFTFEKFHALFFPQGNWQFPVDSWLIQSFPPAFFLGLAIAWFGATALCLWWMMKQTK